MDVFVVDGVVASVSPSEVSDTGRDDVAPGRPDASDVVPVRYNLDGMLLLPSLAEPHAHLDKALTADRVINRTGDLKGAIEAWNLAHGSIDAEDVAERAALAVDLAVEHGVTALRTHIDVGGDVYVRNIEVLAKLRKQYQGLVDLQIVALAHAPLTGAEGRSNRLALAAALAAGADLVGGAPDVDSRPAECVRVCLDAGFEASAGLDLHVDETLDTETRSLTDLAKGVLERGFPHPVVASHCVSLGMMSGETQRRVAALVAEAGIGVVTLPQTNLYLQARGVASAPPRGLTALATLMDVGVRLAGGGDNVQDPFNLMGRGDPLETASLLVTAGHLQPETAFGLVSSEARALLELPEAAVKVGAAADFVAVAASSVREAVAAAPGTRMVFKAGRLTARSTRSVEISSWANLAEKRDGVLLSDEL